jgi:predicted nucleotidyltransferase
MTRATGPLSVAMTASLCDWARLRPAIWRIYVFGSHARGTPRPDSDLDLAFEFSPSVDDGDAELIASAAAWKQDLTALLGVMVKDVYPASSLDKLGGGVLIYDSQP